MFNVWSTACNVNQFGDNKLWWYIHSAMIEISKFKKNGKIAHAYILYCANGIGVRPCMCMCQ